MSAKRSDQSLDAAAKVVQVIRDQLAQATTAAKCHSCGCFRAAVDALAETRLAGTALGEVVIVARASLQPQRYDCLGCAICFPAVAMNAFHEAFPDEPVSVESCPTSPIEERAGWPPLPGDYLVQRYRSPVAVCTLNSDSLSEHLFGLAPDGLAIIGTLHTENLGVERIVRNVVANPHIRFLVLCGEDTRQSVGHLPGQSLASLIANGTDDGGRIIGAEGKRPVLTNLSRPEIEAFRQQVELIDLIGETDEVTIATAVEACTSRSPGPCEAAVLPAALQSIRARELGLLVQDPAGFLVIYPDSAKTLLVVEHYTNAGVLDCVVEGDSPPKVAQEIIARGLITRLDHSAYMGRELARAERCLLTGERYIQDRAPESPFVCADGSCSCEAEPR